MKTLESILITLVRVSIVMGILIVAFSVYEGSKTFAPNLTKDQLCAQKAQEWENEHKKDCNTQEKQCRLDLSEDAIGVYVTCMGLK